MRTQREYRMGINVNNYLGQKIIIIKTFMLFVGTVYELL